MKHDTLGIIAGSFIVCAAAFDAAARAETLSDAYEEISGEMLRYAGNSGINKIAVMNFFPAEGVEQREAVSASEGISEKLAGGKTAAQAGGARLEEVLEGVKLASRSPDRADGARALRDIFSAEAAVTGEVSAAGGKLKILARLNDLRTGRVLYTAQAEGRRLPRAVPPPGVELPGFPGPYPWWESAAPKPADLRDSVSDSAKRSCPDRRARLAELNSKLVDSKARYWAGKISGPYFSAGAIGRNPGIEIGDPVVRAKFYELLAAYFAEDRPAGLAPGERAEILDLLDDETRFFTECGFKRR